MKKSTPLFFYFKNSLYFLFTNKIVVILHLIIEFLDIYTRALDVSIQLLHYNEKYYYNDNQISKYLFYISPYYYFSHYLCSIDFTSNYHKEITISIVFVLLAFYIFMLRSQKNIKPNKIALFPKIFISLFINFYDYLFFRTLSIIPLHIINENLIVYGKQTIDRYEVFDIFLIILLSIFSIIAVLIYFKYFTTFNILSTFKFHVTCFNTYPFDNYVSMKYDITLLVIKILIATSNNYLGIQGNIITSFQVFINTLILLLLLFLSIRVIYHFFINKNQLFLFLLNESNVVRVFLLEFTCISVIIRLMFNSNDSAILFVSFCVLILFFLLYIIITNYGSFVISQAEMSNNYFGVCWFFQSNELDRNKFIMQWIIHHRTVCSAKNCQICVNLCEEDSSKPKNDIEEEGKLMRQGLLYSSYDFVDILYKEQLRTFNKSACDFEEFIKDFLYLTLLFLSKNQQMFKLYTYINRLHHKYKNNTTVLLSVFMCFELIRKENKELIKTYKLIRKSENLNNAIKDYIKHFESFLHYESKTPENFFKIAHRFREIKDNRKTLIDLIKKDAKCNYQTRIIRYLYETILRSPLKILHNESEIYSSEEYLDHHYNNDQICLLKYCIERGTFIVIKASKNTIKYKNKPFDSLFPDYLRAKNDAIFVDRLKNCGSLEMKKIMSFVVKDLQEDESYGFVQDFKMVYSVFPGIIADEMLISISYMTDYDDILIFETPNDREEECLFSCSKSFLKILGLTTEMIQILYKANKIITINNLFNNLSFNIQLGNNSCVLQYSRYAKIYKDLIKYEGLTEASNYSDIKNLLSKIMELDIQKKEITFAITEKYIDTNIKSKYIIYNLIEKNKEKDSKRARDITIIENENDVVINTVLKMENIQTTTIAPTISGFSTGSVNSAGGRSIGSFYKKKSHKEESKEKYKQVRYFTLLILIFGLFLMLLTMIFLILEVNKNTTFQSLFNLFQLFKAFKRSIESIPLSIFSNFCLESLDNTCVNYYQFYSNNCKINYPPLAEYPNINEVISAEVSEKFGTIIESFNDFLQEMYKINFASINAIGTLELDVVNIKNHANYLEIEKSRTTFLDMVRLYSNFVTTILTNSSYLKEGVRLIIISEDGNIYTEDSEISLIQRHLYRLILNYPYLHKGLLWSSRTIENEFANYLFQINYILLGFFLVLLFLHLLLCFMAICFLRTFIKMLKSIIGSIIGLLSEKTYLDFIEKRMNSIKQLCELYSDNPITIIHNITEAEEEHKKSQREFIINQKYDSQNNPIHVKVHNKHEYNFTEKEFNKIVLKYKIVIIIIFGAYVVYSVGYYLLLNKNYYNLHYLVRYSSTNSLIDNYIYDIVLTEHYLALTNTTSFEFNKILNEDDQSDYIKNDIESLHFWIQDKNIIENLLPNLFPPLNDVININCSQFQIEDDTFRSSLEKLGSNYNGFIKTLCEYYNFQVYTSDDSFTLEMLYMTNQLSHAYTPSTYDEILDYYTKPIEYDVFSCVLIFIRIIRKYFNETYLVEKVKYVLSTFTALIIVYLVLNMCLEIVIFLILNFFVIRSIKEMNKKLFFFIHSLKY